MTDQPETTLESELAQWQEWCGEASVRAERLRDEVERLYVDLEKARREREQWKAEALQWRASAKRNEP